MAHELCEYLCLEYKVISYEYFLTELHEWEAHFLMKNLNLSVKHDYIRMRYLMWASLKPHLKKKSIQPEELFPLPYDGNVSKSEIKVTDNDINEIRRAILQNEKK